MVTAVGEPSELLLFASGRQEQAKVELDGEQAAVDRVRTARLGL